MLFALYCLAPCNQHLADSHRCRFMQTSGSGHVGNRTYQQNLENVVEVIVCVCHFMRVSGRLAFFKENTRPWDQPPSRRCETNCLETSLFQTVASRAIAQRMG